ncbi:hypothetical protein SLEP1_g59217, partial [Rubroshorea leprosula]
VLLLISLAFAKRLPRSTSCYCLVPISSCFFSLVGSSTPRIRN